MRREKLLMSTQAITYSCIDIKMLDRLVKDLKPNHLNLKSDVDDTHQLSFGFSPPRFPSPPPDSCTSYFSLCTPSRSSDLSALPCSIRRVICH